MYTSYLIKELPHKIFDPSLRQNRKYYVYGEAFPGEWEAAYTKAEAITEEAKVSRQSMEGGSIFTDYKKLRESQIPIGGMVKIAQRFKQDGTLAEIFTTATQVIAEWKTRAAKGKER